MTATPEFPAEPIRIAANNSAAKRLGNWTSARSFQVRANRGQATLDLRSPLIPDGEITIDVELDHAVLTLLVAEGATVDDWHLRRIGRGRVKDSSRPSASEARRVVLTGQVRHGEIRVRRGGVAILAAMFSREYLADLRQARKHGRYPTVDDPARA